MFGEEGRKRNLPFQNPLYNYRSNAICPEDWYFCTNIQKFSLKAPHRLQVQTANVSPRPGPDRMW